MPGTSLKVTWCSPGKPPVPVAYTPLTASPLTGRTSRFRQRGPATRSRGAPRSSSACTTPASTAPIPGSAARPRRGWRRARSRPRRPWPGHGRAGRGPAPAARCRSWHACHSEQVVRLVERAAGTGVVDADAAVELVVVDVAPLVASGAAELPHDRVVAADRAQPGWLEAGERDQARLGAGTAAAGAVVLLRDQSRAHGPPPVTRRRVS